VVKRKLIGIVLCSVLLVGNYAVVAKAAPPKTRTPAAPPKRLTMATAIQAMTEQNRLFLEKLTDNSQKQSESFREAIEIENFSALNFIDGR
jgi:hypothetical protein